MSDKKPRNMTPQGFLTKTNTKAALSAASFLDQYREFLLTGELAEATSPIIAKLDAGTLLPTPALIEVQYAVMQHIVEVDRRNFDKKVAEHNSPKESSSSKPWTASILNEAGEIQTRQKDNGEMEELSKSFDHPQDAERWVDRRLFDGAPDWHGEVHHATIASMSEHIDRKDAVARILKKKKGPTVHTSKSSTSKLGFGSKASQTRVTFSRG